MRKKVSISCVAAAISVLLALTIIPHHHHDEAACVITERCEKDHSVNDEHTRHPVGENTHHNQPCVAESHYIAHTGNRTKDNLSSCEDNDPSVHASFFPLLYLVADFRIYLLKNDTPASGYREYPSLYTFAEASLSHGLRAPPCF